MDALKLIAQDSMKAEVPNIEIGDTIKIDVNIREGERERIQVFEGTVIARKAAVFLKLSQLDAFLTVLVLKEFSQFTAQMLKVLNWFVKVMFAEQNFTTYVTELVKQLN